MQKQITIPGRSYTLRADEGADLEHSAAEVDMNVVKTGDGRYIEVQGTAEAMPFGRDGLNQLLSLADQGIDELVAKQKAVVGHLIKSRS